jgi:hypothetical protein
MQTTYRQNPGLQSAKTVAEGVISGIAGAGAVGAIKALKQKLAKARV